MRSILRSLLGSSGASLSRACLASALAFGATGLASAQEARVAPARQVGEYAGVTLEGQGTPPRAGSAASRRPANLVTWPGFNPQGGGTFFLQTNQAVATSTSSSDGRFEVLLRDCRTHVRNTRRPLDTRFFNTPVRIARVERRGRNLAFVFELRANVTPQVTSRVGQNGFHFVVVTFPSGSYAQGPRIERAAPPAEESRPAPAPAPARRDNVDLDAMDDERPPILQ